VIFLRCCKAGPLAMFPTLVVCATCCSTRNPEVWFAEYPVFQTLGLTYASIADETLLASRPDIVWAWLADWFDFLRSIERATVLQSMP
jgi:hypothetical protein